jgi:NAD(P)-dependent dehydrogenase (short-subunit alcohol dehydrogenase family)
MSACAITGSASGIGAAIRRRLEKDGARVIGIDLRDAEIVADLATQAGREAAVAGVLARCSGTLDRLVVAAGIGTHVRPPSRVASVNYFGAIDVLDGLFEALRKGAAPAALAIASNSAQLARVDESPYVKALLAHDETEACRLADELPNSIFAYLGSKHALGRSVRRRAGAWGLAGVRINAIAPGPVRTPLLQGDMDDPETGAAVRSFPVPLGRVAEPEEIAELAAFMLGPAGSFIQGSIFYIDGGSDAQMRPDRF